MPHALDSSGAVLQVKAINFPLLIITFLIKLLIILCMFSSLIWLAIGWRMAFKMRFYSA